MKKKIFVLMLLAAISPTVFLSSCSDKDDQEDSIPIIWPSTILRERIAGKWLLTGFIGKDVSADSTCLVFTADGKIILDSNPNSEQGGLLVDLDYDTKVTYDFFYNWAVYNEAANEFEGTIILHLYNEQGEETWGESYSCIIGYHDMRFINKVISNEDPGLMDSRKYVFKRQ